MQGGWQPPPGGGGGGYGPPPGGGWVPPGGTQQGGGAYPPGPQNFAPNPYPQPGGPPGGFAPAPSYGNYEFNEYENSVIDKTASRVKLWGIVSIVIGAFQILSSCGMFARADLATNLPVGIVGIVVGVTFLGAGNALKAVVQTQGNDLMHMMQALEKMSSAFMIQMICLVVAFVLAAIIAVIAMFVLAAVAASQ